MSNGLVPMLKVFNDTARYVDQGGGKRKGSFVNSNKNTNSKTNPFGFCALSCHL